MAEQEFSDEERAAAYDYARRQVVVANAAGVTRLDLDPGQQDGRTAALSVIPPEIADLRKLTALDLRGTQIADLAPLQAMTGLQDLILDSTQVTDLSPLQALTGLQRLSLNNTQVKDLSTLQGLSGLQWLSLNNTQVSDLSALQGLSGLHGLSLAYTQVNDLAALEGLRGLQDLYLAFTQVSDLSILHGLSGLQRLYLTNTKVSDLSALRELIGLQELWLNNTQVSDLSALQKLTGLQKLSLINTQVSDLSVLQELRRLQQLWLDGTQASDLLPLSRLSNLGDHRSGGLWFQRTVAAERDDTHRALAAIKGPQDRAKQVLQYLNGEHPEFGGPPEPYVPPNPDAQPVEPEPSGPVPEIEWEKQDPYGLSFAMTGHLLALNFSASEPAPLAQQILPELREALRQLLEKLRGANFGIRQELFAEAELMAKMVAPDIEEIEGQAVLLWFKSINLGSFIDRDEMARSDGRHDDDLLSAEHLSSLRRVVRASAPFVREFPEARKLDEAHRERKIDSFDPDRLFSVIERAVQAFVLEADAAGVLKQAVEIGSGSGDEATRARTVAGVSENNFWTIVARAAANYGRYAALVVGSATVMVTEGALNKVGSDLADHYRLSHSAVQLLQTIPDALLQSDDRPEDVKQTLMDAKVSIRDVELPPIPSRRPLAPFEAPAPPKRPQPPP